MKAIKFIGGVILLLPILGIFIALFMTAPLVFCGTILFTAATSGGIWLLLGAYYD